MIGYACQTGMSSVQ